MITAWSYSRLKDYDICPLYAFYAHSAGSSYKHLRKFGEAALRGIRVHEKGELYLQDKLRKFPQAYSYVKKPMQELKKLGAVAEGKWCLTSEWEATEYFANDAWLRLAIDARVDLGDTQRVIDFKTGKIYDDHPQQLELYALAAFKMFPEVETVSVENWYLDIGEIHDADIGRDEEVKLTEKWNARAEKMLSAEEFPANPCWKCKWCDFAASKGGPCTEERR